MKKRILTLCAAIAGLLVAAFSAHAQLPTPTYGWNLGNTLEAVPNEGAWGGPATQSLINSVADAGFNTVRVPCAWDTHADDQTRQIDPAYLARVKQIVDWCLAKNLHVVINCHWDGGWLEKNVTDTVDPTINAKMNTYWTQIANAFKAYDQRLLFAGANEPDVDTAAEMNTLTAYYQTFVNAVRATGGNNTQRWLIVQGPKTDIDETERLMNALPNDPTPGRLAVEVHYYGPYQFCLMEFDADWGNSFWFWGQGYHSPTLTTRNPNWNCEEAYMDSAFQKMNTKFVSRGIPVIIGEVAAMRRNDPAKPGPTGVEYTRHLAARTHFHKTVVDIATSKGLRPFFWDAPTSGHFNWTTGQLLDPDTARALTGGAALPPPGGGIIANGTYRIVARHSGKALEVTGLQRSNGANVQQWSYWGGSHQKWTLMHLGNNQYKIIGQQSGKALDVADWRTNDGANVHIWSYGGSANQIWTISATGDGYYRLSPAHAPTKCLDVSQVSGSDGANVQIWQYLVGPNQQWTFQAP